MPGSPPTRIMLPGTMPPPSAKSTRHRHHIAPPTSRVRPRIRCNDRLFLLSGSRGGQARTPVLETGVLFVEVQVHGAGGTVALFPDDQLCFAFERVSVGVQRT